MTNPRDYPNVIASVESSRPLQRGVKMLTIDVDGQKFTPPAGRRGPRRSMRS
jgi:hypothetical protein